MGKKLRPKHGGGPNQRTTKTVLKDRSASDGTSKPLKKPCNENLNDTASLRNAGQPNTKSTQPNARSRKSGVKQLSGAKSRLKGLESAGRVLSRGQRKRAMLVERLKRRKNLVEYLQETKKGLNSMNLTELKKGLDSMDADIAAFEKEAQLKEGQKEFFSLRKRIQSNATKLKKGEEARLMALFWERMKDPAFLSDPVGFTVRVLQEDQVKQQALLNRYKELKDFLSQA